MTKLFSVKSLAFASAAAFALTLAAAPQAGAAEATDITDLEVEGSIFTITTNGDLTSTDDGGIIYYQTAKEKSKIKEGKYTAIATHGHEDGNSYSYNFDKFIGKQTYVSLSLDGVKETTGAALKAAPKLKAKYTATDGFTFSVNGGSFAKVATDAAIGNGMTEFVSGGDGKKYYISGDTDVSWYLNFGGTVYFDAIEIGSTDGIPTWSKTAKVKIAAQPKAPKASLKLDATKAFTWKIATKQEFQIENVAANEKSDWKKGSGAADSWATIIGKAKADWADASKTANIVSGDAITSDININLRTAADKKAASAITVIKLKKSAGSPTSSAVTFETTKASGKTATGASIKAVKEIQYSTDNGTKWKKLAAGKSAKLKDTEKTVLVRIAGQSKKGFVLPSLNTKMETDFATGKATISYIDYDTNGSCKVTTESVEAK